MERRQFLQTLGVGAPVAVVGQTVQADDTAAEMAGKLRPAEPRVFLYDDGRHAAPLYQFAPPVEPADFLYTVDQLVDTGVDALVYFSGLEGGVALYDSKVAQKWGDNVPKWTHPVWYRAGRHLQKLIADGHDPLKLLCDRCHEKGLWLIAANYPTLQGGERKEESGLGRKSDFALDNPQFQVGPDNDPRAKYALPNRFSFLHENLRQERLRVFEELLSRYETDGVELNLAQWVPFCKFSQTAQLVPVLTDWLRELRRAATKAEQEQGRRKRICVRIPSHPDAWKMLGYDVPRWVGEKLVDGLMCMPGLMETPMDQDIDLSGAVELTQGTECSVVAAFSDQLGRQLERAATQRMIWAAAANAYGAGADGFAIVDYHWTPNGWPWTSEEYQTLRLLAHPEMLATADKVYRARFGRGITDWLPPGPASLPQRLVEGKPVEVRFRIADDLKQGQAEGKVASVHLRVRLTNLEASLNDVRIELNGRRLPDSLLQLRDLIYKLHSLGSFHPYGFIYDYELTPELFPKPGYNTVTVTLVKADPNIETQFEFFDIDCAINYRVHRHFDRVPVDY